MKKLLYILLILAVSNHVLAANQHLDSLMLYVNGQDTLYLAFLHDVYVYPPLQFKNKKQEKFYWKTVRDVRKTLPYAKLITADMAQADAELAKLPTDKDRRKWWRQNERSLYKKY